MGVIAAVVFVMARIQRRLATMGLIVDASLNDQATVGVFLLHASRALHAKSEQIMGKVSRRTRDAYFMSEFVIASPAPWIIEAY